MKVIKQNKLLASILTSDILYFTNNTIKNKALGFISNKIEIKKDTRYVLLNIVLLLQNIKQIIRLLQYNFKYYKNFLQIITSSNLYNKIIEYTSKTYGIKNSKINACLNLNNKLNSKMVIYIDDAITQNLNYVMHKTFSNNINSIVLINSYFNNNIFGNYKMFANINNYKKLLFLIMIILLSQKNLNKTDINNINYKKINYAIKTKI